jgi:hypothetical protein
LRGKERKEREGKWDEVGWWRGNTRGKLGNELRNADAQSDEELIATHQ